MLARIRIVLVVLLAVSSACLERGKERREPSAGLAEPPAQAGSDTRDTSYGVRKEEPRASADREAVISLRLAAEPLHLNPLLAGDTVGVGITLGDVYEGLLAIDRPGDSPKPCLAESFTVSDEGRTWRFFLRKGVRFHEGQVLSARDVIASLKLAQGAVGPLRAEFDDLIAIEDEGAAGLVWRFRESRPARIEAFAALPIVSSGSFAGVAAEELGQAAVSRKPNGTGAFQLARWQGEKIELERFAGYWGPAALAKGIRYRVLADDQQALAELRAGRIDGILQLPIASALAFAKDSADLQLVRQSMPAYSAAVFNTESAALPVERRRALSRSFDRKSLVAQLFDSQVQIATGPFVVHSERADPEIRDLDFSLEASRSELARLGVKERPLRVLVPDSSKTMRRLVDIWADDTREVLSLRIEALPFAELVERVRAGDFDITLLSFTTSEDVDLYSLFHSSEVGSSNLSRIADAKLDALLAELRAAKDRATYLGQSRALHRLLVQLAPLAFLTSDARLGLIRPELAGVGDSAAQWGARYMWKQR